MATAVINFVSLGLVDRRLCTATAPIGCLAWLGPHEGKSRPSSIRPFQETTREPRGPEDTI